MVLRGGSGGDVVAHGTQDQERLLLVPSRGDLLAFVAALLAAVAVFGEVLALVIVWMTSVDGAGSTYLEGMAIFGVIPGLLLAGSVLLHLWSVGWIHQIGFHPAYLAPFVLGLALTAGPRDVNRHVLAPALAVLLSVCQGDDLGVVLPVLGDLSPFRLARPVFIFGLMAAALVVAGGARARRRRPARRTG